MRTDEACGLVSNVFSILDECAVFAPVCSKSIDNMPCIGETLIVDTVHCGFSWIPRFTVGEFIDWSRDRHRDERFKCKVYTEDGKKHEEAWYSQAFLIRQKMMEEYQKEQVEKANMLNKAISELPDTIPQELIDIWKDYYVIDGRFYKTLKNPAKKLGWWNKDFVKLMERTDEKA